MFDVKGKHDYDDIEITFESNNHFDSCTLFKWKLNEYGSASGINIPLTKEGKTYKLKLKEETPGTYRYDITYLSLQYRLLLSY